MLIQLSQNMPGIKHWFRVLLVLALFTVTAGAGQAVLCESWQQPASVQSHHAGNNQQFDTCRSKSCDSCLESVSITKTLSDCKCPACLSSFENTLFPASSQNKAPLAAFVASSELKKTSEQAPYDLQVRLDSPPFSPHTPFYTLHCTLRI
jgi:hypothetical protein